MLKHRVLTGYSIAHVNTWWSASNPPPPDRFPHILLSTAKENEVLKQVAFVNYTLNEFKEPAQVLADLKFVENCNVG